VLPHNTYLVLDEHGETRASYNKLHLFDLEIPGRVRLIESETYCQGEKAIFPFFA
jgi:predicted amidohydrolase